MSQSGDELPQGASNIAATPSPPHAAFERTGGATVSLAERLERLADGAALGSGLPSHAARNGRESPEVDDFEF